MIIPDNLLKATLAETFSYFLNYAPDKKSRDYPEASESWDCVTNMLESDDFKGVAPEIKERFQSLANNSTYEYQKQGFIQGFMYAVEMFDNSKVFIKPEPLQA